MNRIKSIVTTVLLTGAAIAATAQSYELRSATLTNGGGTCSGGAYRFDCTLGQTAVGNAGGGSYTLKSGFWNTVVVIQMPGAPRLSIKRVGDQIVLSWLISSGEFTLQETSQLRDANSWSDSNKTVVQSDGLNTVTVPLQGGRLFFRLHAASE